MDEWGAGALWGTSLGGGKRGNVLPVHLECWVPRFPSWCELNKDLRVTWIHKRVQKLIVNLEMWDWKKSYKKVVCV